MSLLNSFTVSGETINSDLTKERPIWRLSSYAPGRDPPAQLVDGKDVSPEEMRVREYELNMRGMGQQFVRSDVSPPPSLHLLRFRGSRIGLLTDDCRGSRKMKQHNSRRR